MKNPCQNDQGFTLVEMIIYIAIMGIVISSFMAYSLSISGVRNKNYAAATVQANGRSALSIMTKKIHEAQAVLTPTASTSDPALSLDMPGVSPNITFFVTDGVLHMVEAGVATSTITDSRTHISQLLFTNLAASDDRANVRIEMTIGYNVPASDAAFGYTKSYRTAVSTRP